VVSHVSVSIIFQAVKNRNLSPVLHS